MMVYYHSYYLYFVQIHIFATKIDYQKYFRNDFIDRLMSDFLLSLYCFDLIFTKYLLIQFKKYRKFIKNIELIKNFFYVQHKKNIIIYLFNYYILVRKKQYIIRNKRICKVHNYNYSTSIFAIYVQNKENYLKQIIQ